MDFEKNKIQKYINGFTLIELLIVIAIIAILASLAIPSYTRYSNKAKFSEIISAVHPYKLGVEMGFQIEGKDLSSLDSGVSSIPNKIDSSNTEFKYVDSIVVKSGVITAISRGILSSDPNYILTPLQQNNIITWKVDRSSTCIAEQLC